MVKDQGDRTPGSKSWDSKPAMRLSRASTSRDSSAVSGAPCSDEGMGPRPASPRRSVSVLNFWPTVGSLSSTSRCDLQFNFLCQAGQEEAGAGPHLNMPAATTVF